MIAKGLEKMKKFWRSAHISTVEELIAFFFFFGGGGFYGNKVPWQYISCSGKENN